MVKRRHVVSVMAMAGLLGGFAWLVLCPHEPVYHGKALSFWLRDGYDGSSDESREFKAEAEIALRAIGTNALPLLLKMASTRDSGWSYFVEKLAREKDFAFLHLPFQLHKRERAAAALKILGPEARPVVPALIRLLRNRDAGVRLGAGLCLGGLGPTAQEAVPALSATLSSISETNREHKAMRAMMTWALGEIGPAARSAIPQLMAATNDLAAELAVLRIKGESLLPFFERLKDTSNPTEWTRTVSLVSWLRADAEPAIPFIVAALGHTNLAIQGRALYALREIHQRPELCVPALIPFLTSTNRNARRTSIMALRAFGAAAKPAVPELLRCLNDSDQWTSIQVTKTLRRIDPEAAVRAGVK